MSMTVLKPSLLYQRFTLKRHRADLSLFDTKCFYLDSKIRRLEIKCSRSRPEDLRRLRQEKARILHEIELLKIDIEMFGKRFEQSLKEFQL